MSRKAGTTYRLLSEAEWEYAARAGTTTNYAFGDTITNSQAQYSKRNTAEVGSFQPNDFGLHDMHGNVSEWCEDSWHPNYIGAPADASAWPSGDMHARVLRGGSWFHAPAGIRSAYRAKYLQDYRASDVASVLRETYKSPLHPSSPDTRKSFLRDESVPSAASASSRAQAKHRGRGNLPLILSESLPLGDVCWRRALRPAKAIHRGARRFASDLSESLPLGDDAGGGRFVPRRQYTEDEAICL